MVSEEVGQRVELGALPSHGGAWGPEAGAGSRTATGSLSREVAPCCCTQPLGGGTCGWGGMWPPPPTRFVCGAGPDVACLLQPQGSPACYTLHRSPILATYPCLTGSQDGSCMQLYCLLLLGRQGMHGWHRAPRGKAAGQGDSSRQPTSTPPGSGLAMPLTVPLAMLWSGQARYVSQLPV